MLFKLLDEHLDAILQVAPPVLLTTELLKRIEALYVRRDQLWSILSSTTALDLEPTLIHWNWLLQALNSFAMEPAPVAVSAALKVCIEQCNTALQAARSYKLLLWKRGGHPPAVCSQLAAQLQMQLLELADMMEHSEGDIV